MFSLGNSGGFKFNLKGKPSDDIYNLPAPKCVGLSPRDLRGFKPRVVVRVGDSVLAGQELAHHKLDEAVKLVSPGSGIVKEIRYGRRRVLEAIVVELNSAEGEEEYFDFGKTDLSQISNLTPDQIRTKLLQMGLWTRFEAWPTKFPLPLSSTLEINSIHVSTFETEPHHVNNKLLARGREHEAQVGLRVLSVLANQNISVYSKEKMGCPFALTDSPEAKHVLCKDIYPEDKAGVQAWRDAEQVEDNKAVLGCSLNLLIDIGHAFLNGQIRTERLYVLSGDALGKSGHFLGRMGMQMSDLAAAADEVEESQNDVRHIAGGLLTGMKLKAEDFVSPAQTNIQSLIEDKERIPFAFFRPGFGKLTASKAWVSALDSSSVKEYTTNNNGEERACIQSGQCVKVCPVNLYPNMLMKAAIDKDLEKMESLSIHDCIDCGLCTFVCPSKIEMGDDILNGKLLIEKEG